ncbi:MAG: SPFH domain-containing protein [Acidobacteria bacterium]|nr:SPFH domain-containing protein [Acidobacteriota bacterium]
MWMFLAFAAGLCLFAATVVYLLSFHRIGPSEVGLVTKRFSRRKLSDDNLIALNGEAGYQAELLMPGLRFRLWPLYGVEKFPWVQIPAGQIGVVMAQVGNPLPVGAKSAIYKPQFGQFADLDLFIREGGQKGVQRPVLPPGTTLPIHPVAFMVITRDRTFGLPVNPELSAASGPITPASFNLRDEDFEVIQIRRGNDARDIVGIVNTLEGSPLPSGDISSRLNGFEDILEMEQSTSTDQDIIELLFGAKNDLHNNYQDFQAFLDHGGRIGLQHDPLLYGAYTINPFLVRVELVPMLVIEQGQVAVIKSYVGLPPRDTSGAEFKFGTLVRPGHRGIWQEPLRTGKYPINPYCYKAEIVPTAILTLNWAERISSAHHLDAKLETITAKSAEGFIFRIDLQVQIHVPDTRAPRVISTVGTINNLVDEVLQAAVGNHFRDTLQSMPAISFIEKRQEVQRAAFERIAELLSIYFVETKGVYIQDVLFPVDLVKVLTEREIAKQEIATFEQQRQAQDQRIRMEQARGTADMQAELAKSAVGVNIKTNQASARRAEAEGESYYIEQTGKAKGAEVRSVGLAKAEAYDAQVKSFGANATAFVNAIDALSKSGNRFVPEILVSGSGGGAFDGLAATLMKYLGERKAS